mgnify:CR=1 FL=1
MSALNSSKKRDAARKADSSDTGPPRNKTVGKNHIFDSWSLVQREPHPESRGTKAKAANQCHELKFG